MEKQKNKNYTDYNNKNIARAKKLRSEMTPQERRLWYCFLRDYSVKFYRQRPIDKYIVDFYCSKAHLVLELDGSQHYLEDGKEYDRIRSDVLEKHQLEVIRFSNLEIDKNFEGVCLAIDNKVKEQLELWKV